MHRPVAHAVCCVCCVDLTQPPEEDIESLCKLMMTIGKTLEEVNLPKVQAYMKEMAVLCDNTNLSQRVRFMCLNVIESQRYRSR